MKRDFTVVIGRDEDGIYVASVPELVGCHTQAKTLDDLRERITEAVQLYLEGLDGILDLQAVVFRGSLKVKPKSHKQMPRISTGYFLASPKGVSLTIDRAAAPATTIK